MSEHDEHWERLSRVEADLDIIKPEVSSLKTDVSYIRSSMEQLLSKQNQPMQWSPLIAAIGLVTIILGGYTTLISQPISADTLQNAKNIQSLERELDVRSYRFGVLDNGQNNLVSNVTRQEIQIDELQQRVSRLEGRDEVISQQIDDIDNRGSRRWNEDK